MQGYSRSIRKIEVTDKGYENLRSFNISEQVIPLTKELR